MEYETKGFVKYSGGNILVLPALSDLLNSLKGEGCRFALFRLVRHEGEEDIPEKSKSFGVSSLTDNSLRTDTFYKI